MPAKLIVRAVMAALVGALILSGCASLPAQHPEGDPSEYLEQRGPVLAAGTSLSEKRSTDVLASAAGATTSDERADVAQLTSAVRRATSVPLVWGNRVSLLIDGPNAFAAMRAAVGAAHHNINVETYIFADDEFGREFAELLKSKAHEGVRVRVIFDALGSFATSAQLFDDMREAGIEVREYQPFRKVLLFPWRYHKRDHRKLLIVDGRIAFTGGLNISGAYASASTSRPGPERGLTEAWRDTHAQIEGPAVQQLQAIFFETWVRLGGDAAGDTSDYPALEPLGNDVVAAIGSSGVREKHEPVYSTYLAAIRHSQHQLWITQAYFSSPPAIRRALERAAKRGVDVRILLPGFTDSSPTLYASQYDYWKLLKSGVRLYEMDNALLHAKTALFDDALVIIGSANLDYRSFLHNNEVTAVIVSDPLAAQMRLAFERDLKRSQEITAAQWKRRPWTRRLKEKLSHLLTYWL